MLLGVDGAAALAREELFAAWRTFFERIAAKGTVVLVFEDLHWADQGTLDFIDHLVEWSRGVPIIVITLARPELFERRPDWGAGRRNFISIGLEPLPEAAIHELLASSSRACPSGPLQAIAERADGIPLYAVETIRMLVAEGRLVPRDGGYVPSGDLTNLAVPETLHALIAARLDALPPAERSLVQDAAVLGQSFTLDGLAAVERPRAAPRSTSSPGRSSAASCSSTTSIRGRPSAASTRSSRRSSARSRTGCSRGATAGRAISPRPGSSSRVGEDELAGALASHYLAAYRAAPDDPDSRPLATQARIALRAAAVRASVARQPRPGDGVPHRGDGGHRGPGGDRRPLERAGQAAVNVEPPRAGRAAACGTRSAARGAWRPVRARTRDGAARPGHGERMATRRTRSRSSSRPSSNTATWWTIPRSPRSSTSWRERTGSRPAEQAIEFADRAIGRGERIEAVELIADALITKGSCWGWDRARTRATG